MIETRTATIQAAVSEDSNKTSGKASPGRSTYKQHWRHGRRDKSKSISPTDGARGLVVSDFASRSPVISARQQEIHQQHDGQPGSGGVKKHHRKRGSHHQYYYARGNRFSKDSPRSNMPSDMHSSIAVQTETRNDLLISGVESATIQVLDDSLSSSLRAHVDMKLPKRDSPASPQCSSIHSESGDNSEFDFEFGLENISLPSPNRTSQTLNTTSIGPIESEAFSFGFSGHELPSISYSKESMGQGTVSCNHEGNYVSNEEHQLAQAFQDNFRLVDTNDENIISSSPSFHQGHHFVVTTNAAGAAILDTLASRTNNNNIPYNYNQCVQYEGRSQDNFGTGYMPVQPVDTSTVNVGDNRIDGNTFMYSIAAPPFVPMHPSMTRGYWNGQTMPSSESNAMYLPPIHSYPLAYAPNGYGSYNMMPTLPPSSPYYLNHNPIAATNHHHPLHQPWPIYSPPPQTPVQYEQVSVGGTVFFTPVYSPPSPPTIEPPTETPIPPMTLPSPTGANVPHPVSEMVDSLSANGKLPIHCLPQVYGSSINGKKKKKNHNKRGGKNRKEHHSKDQ